MHLLEPILKPGIISKPHHLIDLQHQLWSCITLSENGYTENQDYHRVENAPPLIRTQSILVAITEGGQLYDLYKRQPFIIDDKRQSIRVFDIELYDHPAIDILYDNGDFYRYAINRYRWWNEPQYGVIIANIKLVIPYTGFYSYVILDDQGRWYYLHDHTTTPIEGNNLPRYEDYSLYRILFICHLE